MPATAHKRKDKAQPTRRSSVQIAANWEINEGWTGKRFGVRKDLFTSKSNAAQESRVRYKFTYVPPQLSGARSAIDSVKSHLRPWKSSALYWRSP